MSELGERLSKLRRDKGMTQEELASHLQVTRQTVSSYENGKSEPDIAILHKLSEALGTAFYSDPFYAVASRRSHS